MQFLRMILTAMAFAGLGAGTVAASAGAAGEGRAPRPNILVILADDMGYSDLGCYGGEIETPNLDRLAADGLRFTQFYNTARCCPSRASLLTGLYPHQAGMGHMMFDRNLPGYRGDLNRQCVTIAEVLRDAGYRTYGIGKWHLTLHNRPESPSHNWPLQRGFEKYYGLIWGYSSFFDPAIIRGNNWYSRESDPEYRSDNFYFTNALTDNAVEFLRQHDKESPDRPFFLYTAFTAAHWPMHALEEDIARYKGRFDAGYDALRRERVKRLKKLGLLPPQWEVTPTAGDWESVEHRAWELRCMEVYAAMITCMDRGIGRIVEELRRQGRLDNTLILFLQDNGACAEEWGRRPSDGPDPATLRPLRPEELPDGPVPKQTRDGRPVRTGPEATPGAPDSYLGYGEKWANVSNTPFREYKHWVHEGGISTPLIVHWPAGIPESRKNGFVHDSAHLIDIMATCVDVAETTYPSERGGERIKPLQGISLRPAFAGRPLERKEPLFWEHEGNRAVRRGKWKLVAKEGQPWELYDMEADRTEMHDLASERPELVRELAAAWDAWAERCDVLPLGGWRAKKIVHQDMPRLALKAGDALHPEKSPAVHDRALTVSAELLTPHGEGVLAAQGGRKIGYALYVRDGRLCFDLRKGGRLTTVAARETLPDKAAAVAAVLDRNGSLRLLVDGRVVASRARAGLLPRTPGEGLSAGHDSGDPVGEYPPAFPYAGRMGEVRIETEVRR